MAKAGSSNEIGRSGAGVGPAPLFSLENVAFDAGGASILDGLSLTLEAGRIHGLIGPNGSGKSTLVKLLARQQKPTAGLLRFEGEPIANGSARHFARRVAFLPQSPIVPEGTRVADLIAFGRYPWHGALGRRSERDREAIAEAMRRTAVERFRDRPLGALSGGERQRVWLAMLLAQEASCLVLDEPTSALDVSHQAEMLQLVRELAGPESGVSVVIVLHDINMAARICDRLIAMKGGRIEADGPPDTIMTAERLGSIFDVSMGVLKEPSTGRSIGYVA